ncbi:TraR/DksA family transcriptional regulator [Demetria terragena]|uniref:TraR/DksA family transcriptional regulator n=1 Tax=Demetria terragena TaxID=63959 RepID=UPI00037E7717|nr:TraR/DksA C4-type zinc finger protein [Demetria terragena]
MDTDAALQALEAKRAEAIERLRGLDASFADIVESARDSNLDDEHDTEGTTIAASRAQVAALASAARLQLEAIDDAMGRLSRGEYAHCAACGEAIDPARLLARPTTSWCLECARARGSRARR